MTETSDFLIEPGELGRALAEGALLLDTRRDGAFELGHIPGALPFSTYDVFVPGTTLEGMNAFAADMAGRYSMAGASNERPIVVYDDETGMRAARELWILQYLGHRKARMLHGGLRQWVAEGRELDADTEVPTVRSGRFAVSVASGGFASASSRSIISAPSRCSAPASRAVSKPTTRPSSGKSRSARAPTMTSVWRASEKSLSRGRGKEPRSGGRVR